MGATAYRLELEPFHNWWLKQTFTMALNGMPRRKEIFSRLEAGGGEFATKTRSVLGRMSPTSLKLTLRLLRAARDEQPARLSSCLSREFRAIQRAMAPPSDFFEGIRAALVDKDKSPSWSPARVAEVLARRN